MGYLAADSSRNRMIGLLAGYLLASPAFRCPGADGATVEDVVASEYPWASAAGMVPRLSELVVRYPDLADAIESFFHLDVALAR
jgi:hypothetical protein